MRNLTKQALRSLVILFAIGSQASSAPLGTSFPPAASVATDLAIEGPGWFELRDPFSGSLLYTRFGNFFIDGSGFYIDANGLRVRGYNDPALTSRGDLKLDSAGSDASVSSFNFETDGSLSLRLADGTQFVRGQVLLQRFDAPDHLIRQGLHLYSAGPNALPLPESTPPGTAGLGRIKPGALDLSPTPPLLTALPDARRAGSLARGVITATQNPSDLGIRGPGCFLLRNPRTGELSVTRTGFFLVDRNGFVITPDNQRLQGITNAAFPKPGWTNQVGDLKIDFTNSGYAPGANARRTVFGFSRNGDVNARYADGSAYNVGQIVLLDFTRPEKLRPTVYGRFKNVLPAEPSVLENVGGWNSDGSRIEPGLELINVPAELLHLRRHYNFLVQGPLTNTGVATDLALNGTGFFRLRDPRTGRFWVSRNGHFHTDPDGFVLNDRGWRLQGFASFDVSDPPIGTLGDLQINNGGANNSSPAGMVSFSFDRLGKLNVRLADGTQYIRGQVLVQSFREAFRLVPLGGGIYGNIDAALPLDLESPGMNGNGTLVGSSLEIPTPQEMLSLPNRDGFRFVISGEPGSRWVVRASDDQRTWDTIGVIANAPFEAEFSDSPARFHKHRFYRVGGTYPANQAAQPVPESNILRSTVR
ncbi:MAG: hypothetical protein U1F65_10160 [Verrucomicrobiota bacterium]